MIMCVPPAKPKAETAAFQRKICAHIGWFFFSGAGSFQWKNIYIGFFRLSVLFPLLFSTNTKVIYHSFNERSISTWCRARSRKKIHWSDGEREKIDGLRIDLSRTWIWAGTIDDQLFAFAAEIEFQLKESFVGPRGNALQVQGSFIQFFVRLLECWWWLFLSFLSRISHSRDVHHHPLLRVCFASSWKDTFFTFHSGFASRKKADGSEADKRQFLHSTSLSIP